MGGGIICLAQCLVPKVQMEEVLNSLNTHLRTQQQRKREEVEIEAGRS